MLATALDEYINGILQSTQDDEVDCVGSSSDDDEDDNDAIESRIVNVKDCLWRLAGRMNIDLYTTTQCHTSSAHGGGGQAAF